MQLTANKWLRVRDLTGRVLASLDPALLVIAGVLLALATLVMASATADHREALAAFAERRPPRYTNS